MTTKSMPATDIKTYRHTFQQRLQRDLEAREVQREKARQAVITKAPGILKVYPSVERAYLFGSAARPGNFYPNSDIDIALEGTTAAEYFAIWRNLEHVLPDWTVDVREINDTSLFSELIRKTGILIYVKGAGQNNEESVCYRSAGSW